MITCRRCKLKYKEQRQIIKKYFYYCPKCIRLLKHYKYRIRHPDYRKREGKNRWNKIRKDKILLEKNRLSFIGWRMRNRELHNKMMMKVYSNNKIKWRARDFTRINKSKLIKLFGDKCSKCKSKNHLHFHHNDYNKYSTKLFKSKEGIEELKTRLILLCSKCHKELHENLHVEIHPQLY